MNDELQEKNDDPIGDIFKIMDDFHKKHYDENGKHNFELLMDFDKIPLGPFPAMLKKPEYIFITMTDLFRKMKKEKEENSLKLKEEENGH